MPTLCVIRHAQPITEGLLTGQSDPPLSERGRKQACRLRESVQTSELNGVIYSSPLKRALQTALYIGSDPIILPGLAEVSYGDWDGLSWAEIQERWPQIARDKIVSWQDVTPPGGESWDDFARRVAAALALVSAGPLPAVIVAHEAVNAIISNRLVNKSIVDYRQDYCDIRKYEIRSSIESGEPGAPPAGFPYEAGRESRTS
jgi:broad specificity phosphatase PhoE